MRKLAWAVLGALVLVAGVAVLYAWSASTSVCRWGPYLGSEASAAFRVNATHPGATRAEITEGLSRLEASRVEAPNATRGHWEVAWSGPPRSVHAALTPDPENGTRVRALLLRMHVSSEMARGEDRPEHWARDRAIAFDHIARIARALPVSFGPAENATAEGVPASYC